MQAAFTSRDFRDALGLFPTGVTVVTTLDAEGRPHGVTANSFSSVSLDPPLILWSHALSSRSFPVFRASDLFTVNLLAHDQLSLSRHFAQPTLDDKFDGVDYAPGALGAPLLAGAIAGFECLKFAAHPAGDHVLYVGEVMHLHTAPRDPLAFHAGRYRLTAPYPGQG